MSDLGQATRAPSDHQPKRSGRLMSWGSVLLVSGLVVLAIAFLHSGNETQSVRIAAVPYYFVAIVLGVPGLALVVTAFNRLAANVERLVTAVHDQP